MLQLSGDNGDIVFPNIGLGERLNFSYHISLSPGQTDDLNFVFSSNSLIEFLPSSLNLSDAQPELIFESSPSILQSDGTLTISLGSVQNPQNTETSFTLSFQYRVIDGYGPEAKAQHLVPIRTQLEGGFGEERGQDLNLFVAEAFLQNQLNILPATGNAGDTARITHYLKNVGTAPAYDIVLHNESLGDFQNIEVVSFPSEYGFIDQSSSVALHFTQGTLFPGESFELLIDAEVPVGTLPGNILNIQSRGAHQSAASGNPPGERTVENILSNEVHFGVQVPSKPRLRLHESSSPATSEFIPAILPGLETLNVEVELHFPEGLSENVHFELLLPQDMRVETQPQLDFNNFEGSIENTAPLPNSLTPSALGSPFQLDFGDIVRQANGASSILIEYQLGADFFAEGFQTIDGILHWGGDALANASPSLDVHMKAFATELGQSSVQESTSPKTVLGEVNEHLYWYRGSASGGPGAFHVEVGEDFDVIDYVLEPPLPFTVTDNDTGDLGVANLDGAGKNITFDLPFIPDQWGVLRLSVVAVNNNNQGKLSPATHLLATIGETGDLQQRLQNQIVASRLQAHNQVEQSNISAGEFLEFKAQLKNVGDAAAYQIHWECRFLKELFRMGNLSVQELPTGYTADIQDDEENDMQILKFSPPQNSSLLSTESLAFELSAQVIKTEAQFAAKVQCTSTSLSLPQALAAGVLIYEESEFSFDINALAADGDFDGDAIRNGDEGPQAVDTDEDGLPDFMDTDSDNDSISDFDEAGDAKLNTPPDDHDGDGVPDFRSLDSDGDLILDREEAGDGELATLPIDSDDDQIFDFQDDDSDGDTISDRDEAGDNNLGTPAIDTDGDGIPNYLDLDSDGDTILDMTEAGDLLSETPPNDYDQDGQPNFIDLNSDGDSFEDRLEAGDPLLDTPPGDQDNNGVPDYLEFTEEPEDTKTEEPTGDVTNDPPQTNGCQQNNTAILSLTTMVYFILRRRRTF